MPPDGLDKYLDQLAGKTTKKRPTGDDSVARVLDDEFSKLGYGDTARLSILGDVGRENNWNRNIIFGGHVDPASYTKGRGKIENRGIISWNGDRRTKLDNHLKNEGVLGRGDDDELRGMARFMDKELRESFPNVYKKLKGAKGTYEASEALRQYIKYVPDAPYNSPDPEFRVKNNADWAKRARSLGLGQKGLDNYLDGLAGKTTSPTFPTNQPLQTPPTSTGPAAQGRMAIGDSIAAGLIWHGGIEGKANKVLRDFSNGATASGGAPPSQVLKTIQAMPDGSVRGKQIILSTGASNGPAGLDAVQAQIDALRQKGAAGITILGVGPHKNYVGVNDRLEKIAKANGVTFGGALQTGDDGVHPNNYRKLARSLLTAADTRLDSYLDGLAGKTTSPTFAGTQPLTTPPPIDDDIIRVETAIDQQGNMLEDPGAVDSPFKAVEQARQLKNGVAPVAPVSNEIQPPVADKTPLGKLQKRIAPLAPVQQQGAPQVAQQQQQPADPRRRTVTAPPLTRQQLIDTQPVPQPLPNQDYQRSGILKTGNGSALKYVQNDPTFGVAPPEGFERFADDNGQTYLLDQNGQLQDESLAQVAFQATVSLARPSVPLPDAKNAYIMQVADQLGEQYDLNKNDVYAYLEQQGVVDLGTKAPKEEQGFYARPGGGMETLNQASMQAAGLPPIGNQGDTDTFSMSARDLNNLFTYVGQKKEGSTARARDLISKGLLDPNDVQQIQEMGLNPEEFAAYSPETAGRVDPRVYQATKVGQETRRNTERIRNSYLQQGMDPRKAYFAALGDQKILSAKEVDAEMRAIDELRAESAKNNGWLGGLEGAAQVMGQGVLNTSQLALGNIGNEVTRDPMIGTQDRIAALRQKWIEHGLDAQLAKYGSYTKAKSALDSAKAEEAARQARIAKADWLTATAGRTEAFLRGTVKSIMQTPGTVMQGAAVWTKPVADYIDSVFGTQSSSIKQNGVYQFGKWLNSLAPGASARSDYDEEWVGGILGQGIGSSVGMIPMAMGGPIPLMAWSTLQMTGGDFESALAEGVKESDAAQYSRITGGLLGWTERLGIGGGWLRALEGNPATRGFVRKLVTEIARESAEEIFLNEGPQNLGQNLIAKLTIDPNRPWDKGVLDAMATAGISASIMSVIMTSLLHVKHKGQINAALKQAVLNGGPNMVDFGDETGVYIHGKPAEITPEMQPLLEKHRLLSKQMQQGFVDIDEFRKYWQAARQAAAPIAHGAYTELPAGTVENLGEQRWRQHLEDAQREQFRLFQEQQTVAGQLVEASGIPAPTILEQKETAEAAKAEASGDTIIPPGASAADIAAQKYPTAPVVEPSGSETPESETQPDLSPTGETQMPPVITDEMAQQIAEAGNLPAAEQQAAINKILAQNGNAEPSGESAANIPATTAVPASKPNSEVAPKVRPPVTLQGIYSALSAKGQTAASKFLADTDVQSLLPTLGTDQEPQALDGLKKAAANYGLTPSATIAILDRQRTENLKPVLSTETPQTQGIVDSSVSELSKDGEIKVGDTVTYNGLEGSIKEIVPDKKYGDYAVVDTQNGEQQIPLDKLKPVSSGSPAISIDRTAESDRAGLQRINPALFKKADKANTVEEFVQAVLKADKTTIDKVSVTNLTEFFNRVKGNKPASNDGQKTAQTGPKVFVNLVGQDGLTDAERKAKDAKPSPMQQFLADDDAAKAIATIGTEKESLDGLTEIGKNHGLSESEVQGVIDRAREKKQRTDNERKATDIVRETRKPTGETLIGSATTILTPESGKSYEARYVIREAEDVFPSHNPVTFQPNPDYYYTNDRHYDREEQYQKQVIDRSTAFKPQYFVTDTPTAADGPPVIDAEGNVLGGNSRAMILQRIYEGGESSSARTAYLLALHQKAKQFGFSSSDIDSFQRPILVRELSDDSINKQHAITELNEVSTTDLTTKEQAVADAGKLTDEAVDYITAKIEVTGAEATLTEALNAHGPAIVNRLIDEGVFGQGERNTLLDDGKITEDGKKRIERLLLGKVFTDLGQIENTAPSVKNTLVRIISPLMKVNSDTQWNILPEVQEGIELLNEANASGQAKFIDSFAANINFLRPQGWSPQAIGVAKVLASGMRKATDTFKQYAEDMRLAKYGEGAMFEMGAKTQAEAYKDAFGTEPGAKTVKTPLSNTQIQFSDAQSAPVEKFREQIAPADIAANEDLPSYIKDIKDPLHVPPHVTVKWGLHTTDPGDVRNILKGQNPVTITLGKTAVWPGAEQGNYDVVIVEVDSPDLHALNKHISDNAESTDTFPEYKPHLTIAYVKKGLGQKYAGRTDLEGQKMTFDGVTFSPGDKTAPKTHIPFESPTRKLFADSMGVPRSEMPQISRTDMPAFLAFAKEKGVEITDEHVPIGRLMPTQSEYNPKQAAQLPDAALKKPLMISQDYRVLDGHNIFARISEGNTKGKGADVRVIHLPAAEALEFMKSFDKATYKPVEHVGTAAKLAEHQATNPIDFNASQEEKARQLMALTEANKPIVERIVKRFRDELGMTHTELGKNNYKDFGKIIEKANRHEVKANKPWHDVEHIRDAFRFRAGFTSFDQIPQMIQILRDAGLELQKIDTDKFMDPASWGWRPVAVDIRMPNGQLVEFYASFPQMIDAQYFTSADHPVNNHDLYEKWRDKTPDYVNQHRAEYEQNRTASAAIYQAAYEAGLAAAGLDETAARASFTKAITSLGSDTSFNSSDSTKDMAPADQTPSADLTYDSTGGSDITKATGEPSLDIDANINTPSNSDNTPKSLSKQEKARIAAIDKELLGLSGAFTAMSDAGFGAGEVMAEMKKLREEKEIIQGVRAAPAQPKIDIAGLFKTGIKTLEDEQAKDDADDTDPFDFNDVSLKSILERPAPEFKQHVYDNLLPRFAKARATLTETEPQEIMTAFLRRLNEKTAIDMIQQLEPYVVKYFEENVLQSAANESISEVDGNITGSNSGPLDVQSGNGLGERSEHGAGDANAVGDLAGGQPGEVKANEQGSDTGATSQTSGTESGSSTGPKSGTDESTSADIRDTTNGGSSLNPSRTNFSITDELDFERFSPKTRYRKNIEALKLLNTLDEENRIATPEEQSILAQYVGWGGMKQVFDANKADWANEHAELKEMLSPEEYAKARHSVLNAHFTSKPVVDAIWKAADRLGFERGAVLEPSMGTGNFFGLMPAHLRGESALTGVELEPLTSKIAKHLYPNAEIHGEKGFQEVYIAPGSIDLAVGNPPFGDEKIFDKNSKELSKLRIHAYFFAKSINSLRPGGVLSMVISKGFLDSRAPEAIEARKYIAEKANLIGAIRLPNTAFKDNANTEVTTDIVFLQKKGEGVIDRGEQWQDIANLQDKKTGDPIPVNRYFANHPEMMLGEMTLEGSMYRANEPTLSPRPDQDLEMDLADAVDKLPKDIFVNRTDEITQNLYDAEQKTMADYEGMRPYNLGVKADGSVFQLVTNQNGTTSEQPVKVSDTSAARIKSMIGIRQSIREILAKETEEATTDTELAPIRANLNNLYDRFFKQYGYLSSDTNKRLLRADADYPLLAALEKDYDAGISKTIAEKEGVEERGPSAKKADIFTKRTVSPVKPITSVSNANDALIASLNQRGKLDLDYMSQLYSKPAEEIIKELGDRVYDDPKKGEFVTSDEYLSGDVKTKLVEAKNAALENSQYGRNVEALEKVIPEDVAPVDIFVKFGSPWVPKEYYEQFIAEKLEGDFHGYYSPALGKFTGVQITSRNETLNKDTWGTKKAPATGISSGLLSNKNPVVKKPKLDENGRQVYNDKMEPVYETDEAETAAAQGKAEAILDEFADWLWREQGRRQTIAALYNEKFNRRVNRAYDGSHLQLPGLSREMTLRPHIQNFIYRALQSGKALADHVVGAGKTPTAIATAMEMRRLGMAKKPMFTVPNHLVEQWAQEFKKFYPGANVLAATKKDFEKANRQKLFAKIATGDWDAVVVAHSSFTKIKVPSETEKGFVQEQIDEMMAAVDEARLNAGKKDRSVRDMEKAIVSLQTKMDKLNNVERDDMLDFAEMGVDALFVDEAHEYKNLFFTTQKQGVGSLGDPKGSQKAFDMFMKTQMILRKNNDRNLFFLTGTPVSNSLSEIFHMQRYLQYETLRKHGINSFDSWANTFGQDTQDWELDAAGRFRQKLRFVKFSNLPELRQIWNEVTDVIGNEDIKKAALAAGEVFPLPKANHIEVVADRSPEQAAYIGIPIPRLDENGETMVDEETGVALEDYKRGTIIHRMENWKEIQKSDPKENVLRITTNARQAGLDMRLINENAPDFATGKINTAVEKIFKEYQDNDYRQGTQLVFLDLSTPKSAKKGKKAAPIATTVNGYLQSFDIDPADVVNEEGRIDYNSPAMESLTMDQRHKLDEIYNREILARDNITDATLEDQEGDIDTFFAEKSNFSAYDDMREKLIAKGMRPEQIAFIHDYNTDLQKAALFGKVNRGDVRVLLGSTKKMGAGTNVQKKLIALHNIDAPWKPSDLEQRNGRGIRQGNEFWDENFAVNIYDYATEKTYDARMWEINEQKGTAIDRFKFSTDREVEDISPETATAAGMKASATGDPRILESITLKSDIKKLEAQKKIFDRGKHDLESSMRDFESKTTRPHERLAMFDKAVAVAHANPIAEDSPITLGDKSYKLNEISGEKYDTDIRSTAARAVSSAFFRAGKLDGSQSIGNFRGFHFEILSRWGSSGRILMSINDMKDLGRTLAESNVDADAMVKPDFGGILTRIKNMVEKLDHFKEEAERDVAKLQNEYETAKSRKDAEFPKTAELEEMKTRHKALLEELRAKRTNRPQAATSATPATDEETSVDVYGTMENEGGETNGGMKSVLPMDRDSRRQQEVGDVNAEPINNKPGERIVYRLGWKGEPIGGWVGDAQRVADHFNSLERRDHVAGDTLFAYRVPNSELIWEKSDWSRGSHTVLPADTNAILVKEIPYDDQYGQRKDGDPKWNIFDVTAENLRRALGQTEQEPLVLNDNPAAAERVISERNVAWKVRVDAAKSVAGLKSIPDKVSPDERMTVEEMKDLPYVEIEDILDTAEMSRDGSLLKMNAASHELLRRSFEESRIQAAEAQGKTVKQSDYEDLFGGEFLSPAKVEETVEILRSGAAKAESYNYPDEQVQTFKDHADMLEAAAAEGQGTVVVFILDSKLPHELFHQADYIGAAEKTLLNRHTPEYKTKLDQHPIRQILWDKHYSKYNEYKRYTSQKALNATLRAEIPAFLLESTDKDLAAMGITPEMQADYMLMWFEGYAAKNGIESLDHFDKEELDVQDFIAQVKEAYKQNESARKKGKGNNGGIERSGEASSDVAGNTSGQSGTLAESPGIRLTAETHFGRRIEKREIEKELGFDKDTRLRSLPLTLRRAGIDALDAAYEVFHDPAAIEAAQALLDEHGMEGSIALLRNIPAAGLGAEHGILSFMLMKALQNHAASIRDTDPETARKHFELSLELAREHAVMATSLGQYTRVPSIIGPSVETLMYAIQGIIEARGTKWHHKTMTPEAWENIEAMGRRLETALTKVEDLRRRNKNKQAQIKRLEDEKAGKRRRRTSAGTANRQRLVDLVKDDKKRVSGVSDARQRLLAKFAAKGDEIADLKSVIPSDGADLDATPTLAQSDPEALADFSEVGAMMLTEGLSGDEEYLPADFKAEMLAEYGNGIEPYFDEIYKAAWAKRTEWLNQVASEQTKERIENKYNEGEDLEDWEVAELLGKEKLTAKRRRFIEKYHAMTVGAKKPKKNIDAYKAIITDLTQDKSDATAIAAISFAEGVGTAEIHQRFVDAGVTNAEDQRQALREGNVIWEKAKVEFTKQQEAVANEILKEQGELRTIDELQWIARNELQASQRVVADEIRRIKNGEGWYALSKVVNVANASRTMMASFDFSGALRQGGFFTYSKPEMQAKAFANMYNSLGEKGFGRAIQDLEAGANFVLSQRMGIDYAIAGKTDEGSMMGEELFRGDETIEHIPIIGKLVAEGIVKWSERTYTAFLDTQRYVMADLFAKELMAAGMTFRSHPEEFKKIGDFINIATGRGVMPGNKWSKLLMDLPLFAPRYTLSRFQLINITLNPVAYANMPPAARKIIAKQALRFYGTTMGILGLAATLGAAIGASVNWDPDDDDFGKISVGNTKYDIFVGMLPTAKLLIKIVHSAIRTKGSTDNRVTGEFWFDTGNALLRFARGKLSPAASLTVDALSGKDYPGNKTELVARPEWFGGYPLPGKAIYSRLIPLVFNDLAEAYKLDGVVGVARSTPLTMFGVGVSNYKPRAERPETPAEKLAAKMSAWDITGESKLTKEARELKNELVARSRRGEDVSAEVAAAVKEGLFGDYHKREILTAAKKTLLEDKAEGLGLDYMETLLRYANPDEAAQLMPLINRKMKDADEKGELKADQRTRLEGKGASIVGFFPMPDAVKEQFDVLGLKIPDVGESMTLEKGGPKTKLEYERYDRYRREALEKIYTNVEMLVSADGLAKNPEYQNANENDRRLMMQEVVEYQNASRDEQLRMVKKIINKQRNKERKETKDEMTAPVQ